MIPASQGTYALLMSLAFPETITIGRLGTFCFPAGYYLYLGSALGPGGLAARVGRHRRPASQAHWHIDYLRPILSLEQVWFQTGSERRECRWAAAARSFSGSTIPAPRLGASDCRCPAHLVHYSTRPAAADLAAAVGAALETASIP